ncbi:MAG: hypothetical protein ACWGMZ_00780 [Thermoguttaceae bacterium]
MIHYQLAAFFQRGFGKRRTLLSCLVLALAVWAVPVLTAAEVATKPAPQRCGFYLHGAWKYHYPFAVRSWKPADYHRMFLLLKRLGFNTVMLWPVLEAAPMPLSHADREAVRAFRSIIEDARKCALDVWLVLCVVTSNPEIAAKPWMERSLYAHMKTVRMDDPEQAQAFLNHRAAFLEILNNADGYVTIDGDPGGYAGANPSDFLKVLLNDRQTLDRVGTHPRTQEIIPWIWAGWGTKGVWQEPIAPYVAATLEALKQQMPEPWELLPGRSHKEGWANGRINFVLTKKAGLLDRSTLLCYESIEFEPSIPAARLQFDNIRRVLKQEMKESTGARGWFSNAQQPIMVIPNMYLFARGVADPSYLDQSDEKVLTDLAEFLGGPPELLVPAWSCLQRKLEQLPADLPAKLRAAKLSAPVAALLPGGPQRYLDILATQVDSRIRLLRACSRSPDTPQDAAMAIADATSALVEWWKLHHYVGAGEGTEKFRWQFAAEYPILRTWCAKNVADRALVSKLAAAEIVARGVLPAGDAKIRVRELLK